MDCTNGAFPSTQLDHLQLPEPHHARLLLNGAAGKTRGGDFERWMQKHAPAETHFSDAQQAALWVKYISLRMNAALSARMANHNLPCS